MNQVAFFFRTEVVVLIKDDGGSSTILIVVLSSVGAFQPASMLFLFYSMLFQRSEANKHSSILLLEQREY